MFPIGGNLKPFIELLKQVAQLSWQLFPTSDVAAEQSLPLGSPFVRHLHCQILRRTCPAFIALFRSALLTQRGEHADRVNERQSANVPNVSHRSAFLCADAIERLT
jgi:hypothetical protein